MEPKLPVPGILCPLTATRFSSWLATTEREFADEQAAAGTWAADTALAQAQEETRKLLPDGMQTPGHSFYSIVDDIGTEVGTLWIAERERGGQRIAYVYDIAVHPQFQRQGHATRALDALDEVVRQKGLAGVALHVFGHNAGAHALYTRMGYITTDISMFKKIE